jgi:hypothetical protein
MMDVIDIQQFESERDVYTLLEEDSNSYVAAMLCAVGIVLVVAAPIFIYRMWFR